MNNKIIMAIIVAAVVVVGAIGVAVVMKDDEKNITYHGNGYKTADGKETIKFLGDTAPGVIFISDMELYNWNTEADGSGTYVEPAGKIPSGVTDLYAQWVNVIHFTHSFRVATGHYQHISVSTETTVQGTLLTKNLGYIDGFGYSYSGTGTKIIFTTTEDAAGIYVDGSNVLFTYSDGTNASFNNVLSGIEVLESHVSDKSAVITVSDKTNGDVKIKDESLAYKLNIPSMEGIHFEYITEGMTKPVEMDPGDLAPILSDDQAYLRLVVEGENAQVFGATYGVSISYRIDGVNQPALYYRVSCTEGGYIDHGETVPLGGGNYENYFVFQISPSIGSSTFSLITEITVELSTTPFE